MYVCMYVCMYVYITTREGGILIYGHCIFTYKVKSYKKRFQSNLFLYDRAIDQVMIWS